MHLKPELKHFRFMKKKYIAPLLRAFIYVALNKQEKALEYLEKSSEIRDYFFPALMMTTGLLDAPGIEELKDHPRFKALKKKITTK